MSDGHMQQQTVYPSHFDAVMSHKDKQHGHVAEQRQREACRVTENHRALLEAEADVRRGAIGRHHSATLLNNNCLKEESRLGGNSGRRKTQELSKRGAFSGRTKRALRTAINTNFT